MAAGDLQLRQEDSGAQPGARRYNVAAGATAILSGEPVGISALGDTTVIPMATNQPSAATSLMVGIACSNSTQTASAAGTVDVVLTEPEQVWLIKPKTASSWDAQSEYDALVGKRVLIDLTSGSYTLLATDSANNGCVVQALDISKTPGKVAISFRAATSYLA